MNLLLILYVINFSSTISFLDEAEEETPSVPTPTPIPRITSYSGTIVVKNIPNGVKDYVLGFYLHNLTGVPCQKIQMKGAMAVVEMKEKIGENRESYEIFI